MIKKINDFIINKIAKFSEQKKEDQKIELVENFSKDFKDISISIIPLITLENILTIIWISEWIIFSIYLFVWILFTFVPIIIAFWLTRKYKNAFIRWWLSIYSWLITWLWIFIWYQISMYNISNVIEKCIK